MPVRTKVAGATNSYSPWPRENLLSAYDLQAWKDAGCSFVLDPANINSPPASGLLQVLDALPGSTKSIIQPTGFTPIVANERRGYLGGNRTLRMDALLETGLANGSQSGLYQYMSSSNGVLPNTVNAEYEAWFAVHPFSTICAVASDNDNTAAGGFTLRVVNGDVIFGPAAFTAILVSTGLGANLKNRSMLIHVRRYLTGSMVEVLLEGNTTYMTTTGAAINNALPTTAFRLGKRFNLYNAGSNTGYGEFGCAIVNIGDVGATIRAEQKAFMEVRHGFR
jgi:hypothetical protein